MCLPRSFSFKIQDQAVLVPRVCRNILHGNVKFWILQNVLLHPDMIMIVPVFSMDYKLIGAANTRMVL